MYLTRAYLDDGSAPRFSFPLRIRSEGLAALVQCLARRRPTALAAQARTGRLGPAIRSDLWRPSRTEGTELFAQEFGVLDAEECFSSFVFKQPLFYTRCPFLSIWDCSTECKSFEGKHIITISCTTKALSEPMLRLPCAGRLAFFFVVPAKKPWKLLSTGRLDVWTPFSRFALSLIHFKTLAGSFATPLTHMERSRASALFRRKSYGTAWFAAAALRIPGCLNESPRY